MENYTIKTGYHPGVIGRITELHATYYHKHWGFGHFFEAKVAIELSSFINRFDDKQDGFWTAVNNDKIIGSLIIDGIKGKDVEGAHLRWFILSQSAQGHGIGNDLMEMAMKFCRWNNYKTVYLHTFEGLNIARHLYEKFGFKLANQSEGEQWGVKVSEQKFVLNLQ